MVHPGEYPDWSWLTCHLTGVKYCITFLSDQGLARQWLSLSFQDHDQDVTVHLLRTHTHTKHRLIPQIVDSFPSTRATHLLAPLGLFSLDVDRKWRTNPDRLLEWAAEQITLSVVRKTSSESVWVNGIHRGQITECESECLSALPHTEYLHHITYSIEHIRPASD